MGRIVTIVIGVAVLLTGMDASAAGRWHQRSLKRVSEADSRPSPPRERPPYVAADSERYPKFIGGFHSRELQNIGVPTGDQGLRGNGFWNYAW